MTPDKPIVELSAPFAVGDLVETTKGAKFWGEVVSCYRVPPSYSGLPSEWRCDVRAVAPDFLGTIHVYPTAQISHRASPTYGAPVAFADTAWMAAALSAKMTAERFSDRVLAAQLNLDKSAVCRARTGKAVKTATFLALCRWLGVNPVSPSPVKQPVGEVTRESVIEECAKLVEGFTTVGAAYETEDEGGIKWPHPAAQLPIYNPEKLATAIRALASNPTVEADKQKVRELEWETPLPGDSLTKAPCAMGFYQTWTHHEAGGTWFWALYPFGRGQAIASGEDARGEVAVRAAAQVDFCARISGELRSALSPTAGERG